MRISSLILASLLLSTSAGVLMATADASAGGGTKMTLAEAIATLDPANDEHWTQGGLAKMEYLEGLTGGNLTRAEVDAASAPRRADLQPNDGQDGGTVEQQKQTLDEGLAAGPNPGIEEIGEGSITETAPAVSSTVSDTSRVVQQGDEVVLHVRSPINGRTDVPAAVLKINQDGTIAVRIPDNGFGQPQDFSPVYNQPQNGEFWWSWPDKPGAIQEASDADEAEDEDEDVDEAEGRD